MKERTVFFSPEFVKDFKKAERVHHHFPDDFDNLIRVMRDTGVQSFLIPGMPKGCNGFRVFKIKKFYSTDLKCGSRSGYRVIYTEYEGSILFVECYHKGSRENEDRPRICRSLGTVRDGSCVGHYVRMDRPNTRFLLRLRNGGE